MAIEPDIVVAVGRRADSTVTIANLRGQVYGERTFDTAHVPAVDPDQHDWSNYVLAAYQVRAATRPRNQWQRPPTLPSDADGGRVAFPSLFAARCRSTTWRSRRLSTRYPIMVPMGSICSLMAPSRPYVHRAA